MKKTREESKKRVEGDVVRVPLADETHSYARVLPDANFAFYDTRATEDLPVEKVVGMKILFIVPVMDYAIKKGRWLVTGHIPLEKNLLPLPMFIQDPLNENAFSIYENGAIRPATRTECLGLERAAVWEPEQVEDRLRDYYAGHPNKWYDSVGENFGRPC